MRALPAHVGDQTIFELRLIQPDRLARLAKQIDDWRATQGESVLVNDQLLPGHLIQQDEDVQLFLRAVQMQVIEIEKKIFLR